MINVIKNRKRLMIFCLIALLFKIVLAFSFSSDYQTKMFEPFVGSWLEGLSYGIWNPYQHCYDQGLDFDFPYPIVMLLIVGFGYVLGSVKISVLVADIAIMICLCRLFPNALKRCLVVYFLSPIVLYASYMHGQLDLIPMALLFISLYFIALDNSKKNFLLSSLFLALAVLAKFHIVAVTPLIVAFVYKKLGLKNALQFLFITIAIIAVGVLPFWGEGFIHGVVFNREQNTLFSLFFPYADLKLYLSIFALLGVYAYIMSLNLIGRGLLYVFCGMIFSVFLAMCVPMPGWYLWIVPFVSFFIVSSTQNLLSVSCFISLQLLYIVYFIFLHHKTGVVDLYLFGKSLNFLKIDFDLMKNVCFTLLSANLIYMNLLMFRYFISENGLFKFRHKSFVIGICGDSGSGKSTLQNRFSQLFRDNTLLRIEGDGDHKWERNDSKWNEFTHLNPKANFLYRQARDIAELKNGKSVRRIDYNHSTGKFVQIGSVYPKRFISVSGLHTLYLPQQRDNIDLKIYLEASEDLRCLWKIGRDSVQRGYCADDVLKQIRSRYDDFQKYIAPQQKNADIVIHYFVENKNPLELGMNLKISSSIDIESLAEILKKNGIAFSYEFSDDYNYQIAQYHPCKNEKCRMIDFDSIANQIVENRYDISCEKFVSENVIDGITKLIMLKAVASKLRG